MKTTRTIYLGEKKVVIANVPDYITDAELEVFALRKIMQMQITKEMNPQLGVGG